ncbi:MAG: hypothetical protein Q9195_002882 [Heterodermia aff. obscurata]
MAGKQIVYHTIQESKDGASLEELAAMDQEIAAFRESIATAKANEKLLKVNLAAVNATVSIEELRSQIMVLGTDKVEILDRLGRLQSGDVKPVPAEEKTEANKAWTSWSKKAASRKRMCLEMWSYCTEQLPKDQTKQELWARNYLTTLENRLS